MGDVLLGRRIDRLSERPMCVTLTLGPNSAGTVTISFPGKRGHQPVGLSAREIYRLHAALGLAKRLIEADDGDRTTRCVTNLLEHVDV